MAISTKERLAQELHGAGLLEMEKKARAGHYDDYESPLVTPCIQLVADLTAAGRRDLAERAMDGEWDGTREEAEAWMKREGTGLLARPSQGEK